MKVKEVASMQLISFSMDSNEREKFVRIKTDYCVKLAWAHFIVSSVVTEPNKLVTS